MKDFGFRFHMIAMLKLLRIIIGHLKWVTHCLGVNKKIFTFDNVNSQPFIIDNTLSSHASIGDGQNKKRNPLIIKGMIHSEKRAFYLEIDADGITDEGNDRLTFYGECIKSDRID